MEQVIQSIYSNEFISILQEISGKAYREQSFELNDEETRNKVCKEIEDKLKEFGMAMSQICVKDISSQGDIDGNGISFEIRDLPPVQITLKPQTTKV